MKHDTFSDYLSLLNTEAQRYGVQSAAELLSIHPEDAEREMRFLFDTGAEPVDAIQTLRTIEARRQWSKLRDIPVTPDDLIAEPFNEFPAGTDKFTLWAWFEASFGVSVAVDLMGFDRPSEPVDDDAETEVLFPHFCPKGELRNGLVTLTGVVVSKVPDYDFQAQTCRESIEVTGITSRNSAARGFLRLPNEESVLRKLAETFSRLADQAAGKDITSAIAELVNDTEKKIEDGLYDQEQVTMVLDDLVHDSLPNARKAAEINNQGHAAQIRHLLLNGSRDNLATALVDLEAGPGIGGEQCQVA